MAKKDNNYYFEAFTRGITCANEAAKMLDRCLNDFKAVEVQSNLNEMHEIEHKADGIKHEMMEKLVKEFLPPIEREDIVKMAHTIDDVTDAIEDVLRGIYMYNITELRPEVAKFTELIARCCETLIEAAGEFHNFRKSSVLKEKLVSVNALEEDGDALYTEAVRALYKTEGNPVAVIAWTTLFERFEKCCDCCENVAEMMEQVILKNS